MSKKEELNKIAAHIQSGQGKDPWKWVFYGDSVTHGAAHTKGWRSFPEIFSERLRWELLKNLDVVINSAFSGWTTAELLEYYDSQVRFFRPKVVSVMIGMNDMIRPGIPSDFQRNLRQIMESIRADEAIPVLHTCNQIDYISGDENTVLRYERMPEYMSIIRSIAAEMDIILVDNNKVWPTFKENRTELLKWLGESIHPGGRGHLEIANLMLKELGMFSETSACSHVHIE